MQYNLDNIILGKITSFYTWAQVNPSFPIPNYIIWKGPLPHKYTPVWVTYVRESLGGVTGVGGDPNQVPAVGEFL